MRYEIDERGGCIAVIDTTIPPPSSGLHESDAHVVWYGHGESVQATCPTCHHRSFSHWEVPESLREEARRVCDEMNRKEPPHA